MMQNEDTRLKDVFIGKNSMFALYRGVFSLYFTLSKQGYFICHSSSSSSFLRRNRLDKGGQPILSHVQIDQRNRYSGRHCIHIYMQNTYIYIDKIAVASSEELKFNKKSSFASITLLC